MLTEHKLLFMPGLNINAFARRTRTTSCPLVSGTLY
eukprot:gene4081-1312_t